MKHTHYCPKCKTDADCPNLGECSLPPINNCPSCIHNLAEEGMFAVRADLSSLEQQSMEALHMAMHNHEGYRFIVMKALWGDKRVHLLCAGRKEGETTADTAAVAIIPIAVLWSDYLQELTDIAGSTILNNEQRDDQLRAIGVVPSQPPPELTQEDLGDKLDRLLGVVSKGLLNVMPDKDAIMPLVELIKASVPPDTPSSILADACVYISSEISAKGFKKEDPS